MKEHKFTAEQSEKILNAIDNFMNCYGNAYEFSMFINEATRRSVLSYVEDDDDGRKAVNVSPLYLEEIFTKTEQLTKLMFDLDEVVLMDPIFSRAMESRNKVLSNIPG